MRTLYACAALLLAGGLPAAAQAPVGMVTGRVESALNRQPVEGALIRVVGTSLATRSRADGRFRLDSVPVGEQALQVAAIGHEPRVLAGVMVGSGRPVVVVALLEPLPLELDSLVSRAAPVFVPGIPGAPEAPVLVAEEVRRAPGVQEDVLRAVALLPGVAVTVPGRNDLVVRGGAPFENLFVVDGIEVANLNHFGSQGSTGGPLTLLDVEFVEEAAFSAGGFGVRFGDRAASVTAITLREGNQERLAGGVTLSATGFGASVEGPLGPDGSFLAGLRRSYLDLVFRAAGFSFIPAYWDLQAKATQRFGSGNVLSLVWVGARDDLTFDNSTAENRYDNRRILALEQRQYFGGLTWRHSTRRGVLLATLGRSFSRFRSVQNDTLSPPTPVFRNDSREGDTSLQLEWQTRIGSTLDLSVGGVARRAGDLEYALRIPGELRRDAAGVPQPLDRDTSFRASRQAAWAEAEVAVAPGVLVTAGMRVDHYAFLRAAPRWAPRLRVETRAGEGTTLSASVGRYWQSPSLVWLAGDPSNRDLQPLRADQVVVGLRRLLGPGLRLQVEAYARGYARYPARVFRPQAVLAPSGFEDATSDIPFGLEPLVSRGTGHSWGAEILVQRRGVEARLSGLASVSLNRTRFTGLDGVERPGSYDTRALGTLLAIWKPGPGWEVSGKFRWTTGRPTTPFETAGADAGRLDFSRYNDGPRLPVFHALDVRADRKLSFRRTQLGIYLDIQNLYGRPNVTGLEWDPRTGRAVANRSLGVFPTLGITLGF